MAHRVIILLFSFVLFFPAILPQAADSDNYDECTARCSSLAGADRHRCVKMCVSTRRKNSPGGKNETKQKMQECEESCEDYEGVDRIKCIRLCLDRKKEAKARQKVIIKEKENPCETRCGLLTGAMKDKCMLKCEKDIKFESRYNSPGGKK